jgi:hypothetical protein
MAFATTLLADALFDRWSSGFVNGALIGAGIGLVVAVISKVLRASGK